MVAPVKTQAVSARESVYRALRQQIMTLELAPGQEISEKDISLRFDVSRTPVRESFVRLAQDGLLEVYPQRGTQVSLIDTELVEEARFMREQLERAVIRLACGSFPAERLKELKDNLALQRACIDKQDYRTMFELDESFHRTIFEGCAKSNTWAVIQQINVHLNRSRMLRLTSDHRWDHLFEQHAQMVKYIEHRDERKAKQLMKKHMSLTIADQTLLKTRFPDYFK